MSSYFVWDDQLFNLNVPSMDEEHQKLIAFMNSLYNMNQSKASKSALTNIINDLFDFVILHFQNEEAYMEKIKFKGLQNHRIIHHRLIAQLKQHKLDFESDPSGKVNDRFFEFLALWLTAHIQFFDRQYSLLTNPIKNSEINN